MNFKKLKNIFNNKRIFITGNSGFIGSYISLTLSLMNSKILCYSLKKDNSNYLSNFRSYKNRIKTINDDIKNISYQIYNLVTKRNNIINKTNKTVSKKKPTSGESSIIKILNDLLSQNKIFYYEWDKVLPIKFKNNLRADLFIIDNKLNKYIIEYDGIQHNQYIPFFHTNNNFDISKHRDKLKNKYCNKNNIKILHIPYTSSNIDIYSSVYSFIKPT